MRYCSSSNSADVVVGWTNTLYHYIGLAVGNCEQCRIVYEVYECTPNSSLQFFYFMLKSGLLEQVSFSQIVFHGTGIIEFFTFWIAGISQLFEMEIQDDGFVTKLHVEYKIVMISCKEDDLNSTIIPVIVTAIIGCFVLLFIFRRPHRSNNQGKGAFKSSNKTWMSM